MTASINNSLADQLFHW